MCRSVLLYLVRKDVSLLKINVCSVQPLILLKAGHTVLRPLMFVSVVCKRSICSLVESYILPKFDLNVRELEEHVMTTCHLFRILRLMMFQHEITMHSFGWIQTRPLYRWHWLDFVNISQCLIKEEWRKHSNYTRLSEFNIQRKLYRLAHPTVKTSRWLPQLVGHYGSYQLPGQDAEKSQI